MHSDFREKKCFNRTELKKSAMLILILALASLFFTGTGFGATIQGLKFYDRNANTLHDAGEQLFPDHVAYVRNLDTLDVTSFKMDATGHYTVTGLAAGNYHIWSPNFDGWTQTAPTGGTGIVVWPVKLSSPAVTVNVNFGITDTVPPPPPPQPACAKMPTVRSIASGNWNDPGIWDTGTVPANGDWVLVEPGHTLTTPNKIELGNGGFCNKGKVKSANNVAGQPVKRVEIHALSVHNEGVIGKETSADTTMDGVDGRCYVPAIPGSSIEIWATLFINEASGKIHAGNGGNSLGGCRQWECPSYAGAGGRAEVFSITTINEGILQGGNGGRASGCHAPVIGGDGGLVRIITNAFDASNVSRNSGFVISGNGGNATGPPNSTWAGHGGNLDIYLAVIGGNLIGTNGSAIYVDPINLKFESTLRMQGADSVVIYTDEGGTIDMTQLKQGAITAAKTITIATKSFGGNGGSVDLQGVSGKIFKAGEKIEIFADTILTDTGVAFQDLADAPQVVVSPGKVLYLVELSADRLVIGEPGQKVPIRLKLVNAGPNTDKYGLTYDDSENWYLGTLPYNVAIGGLNHRLLDLDVYFPTDAKPGQTNKITITATSQKDPAVSSTVEVIASVKLSAQDIADMETDTDNDGLSDFDERYTYGTDLQNPDTDNDGVNDGWETQYGLNPLGDDASGDLDNDGYSNLEEYTGGTNPRDPDSKPDTPLPIPDPDDSITVSGTGEYKMFVTPSPDGVAGEMQVTQKPDGSYRGSDGKTSVVAIPDPGATGDNFTFTIGRNLTGTGEASSVEVTPNSDGTHTFKVPEEPTATVIFNPDESYTFTDTESPGMVLSGEPDGTQEVTDQEFPGMAAAISPDDIQTVTSTEFPGMAATLSTDGELTITDSEFPGMTYTVSLDDIHTVADMAFPGTGAVINEDGTYTITDTEFPGVDIIYNPDDGTYTVSDAEFPGAKITFSPDGSYTVTEQDGTCYDVNKSARRGWFKKFVNKASRAVSKVAGFVKKTARFVGKVANFVGKAARFVSKVAKFVAKAAPVVSKVFRAIGAGALFVGSLFPPLCPLACTISGFANAAANVSAKVGVFAGKVAGVADKVAHYAGKVGKYAGRVERYAGKVQIFANRVARWSRQGIRRAGKTYRKSDPQDCQDISLYKAFGTITDNAGNPMVNISVRVRDIAEPESEYLATTTDNTGYWEVIGLSDGEYIAVAQKQGCIFTDTSFTVSGQNKEVAIPCNCETFVKGVFTAGPDGIVTTDWLYDGGAYRGELGIFEISGMENLMSDLKAFVTEAVRRVMSDSEQGYLVLSDPNEGARFSGQLGGEPTDWNSGRYNGVKSFQMRPGARFATMLVPNSTFQALARDPGTASPGRRPLFSLVSSNPAYGMYLGQVADINGMGKAFVYEDIWAANSDKDYNDLIIQITGASADDIPSLDSLVGKKTGKKARRKNTRRGWTDWRTMPGLGRQIMEHLGALDISPNSPGVSVTLKSSADLLIYDPQEREISKQGGYIPGATYTCGENGLQTIKLPKLESGDYRIVLQGLGNSASSLEIKGYMGNSEIGSQEQSFAIQAHQTLTSTLSAGSFLADQTITLNTPDVSVGCNGKSLAYDFDGDGDTDIADVMKVVAKWGTQNGAEEYDGFYDFDDDGYIRLPDIMKVVNSEGCKD